MISKSVTKKKRTKKKLNEYETFVKDEPVLPDFTCPHVDNVNDWLHKATCEMEQLRIMNSQLRDNAEYWKQCCEEMQEKLNNYEDWKANLKTEFEKEI